MLQVEYKNNRIRKICTKASDAVREYGIEMAKKIHMRIDEMIAAGSVEEMLQQGIGRCHPLHHNQKNQYAVDLVQPMRLVFEKRNGEIQIVSVIEIIDYHK